MKNAVKTESKAIEMLQNWLSQNITDENLSTNTVIDDVVMKCECGETQGKRAYYEGGNKIGFVAICEICGDDDNFSEDCIKVI